MTDALVKAAPAALAKPSYLKEGDVRGTENIKRENLILPRLTLAQPQSPELTEDGPKEIKDLKKGDAFNSLTGQVYGKGPIDVVIVRIEEDRFIEFNPIEQGGGIKDFDVQADDPRTQFTTDAAGKTVKPVATRFLEFVALRVYQDQDGKLAHEPIALSFKGAGLKAARTLQSLISLRGKAPAFITVFTLTPTVITNTKGTFSLFNVKLKDNAAEETFRAASELYDSFKVRDVVIDREPGSDDGEPKTEF